ncbi:MAG: methyltransferase domain-containing protein [Armatimonadetes bacterium]|nr:methyltransferase domain-containing protein [Armatimonadota bacterium]NIO75506.1 methyltransferase domain-containing protein [Armatimonadota bacterium]NIO95883.1 methyltransferase domain-containing protein [Armatimonadota bacterium]
MHRAKADMPNDSGQEINRAPSPAPVSDDDPFSRIAPFYDQLMASIPYSEWVDYIEKVMAARGFKPTRVLDVACGTGTVAIILAQRGYCVGGVDCSSAMLEVARKKAASANIEIPFYCQNAAQLKLKEKFDLAVCLYDSFNYILEEEELLAAFRGVRRSLQQGAAFLFDLNSLHSFQAELFTQKSPPNAEMRYEWKSRFDAVAGLAEIEMYFEPPGMEPFRIVHCQRAYPAEDIISLLRRARFEVVDLFDAYTLLPPGRFSERIFYLARKPEASKTP